ncbi:MAG: hypothetical protein LBU05_03130 [Bifidobacteriaceae bacterium]|jgi:hypothetical protein|nr:hypothetical protein [Bifidobacteriaceae bacterium]
MGLFDGLRGMVSNLEAQAQAGDEGAKSALGFGAMLKGTLGDLGEAAQQSAIDRQRADQRRAEASAFGDVCERLGLKTDQDGDLTGESRRKVFRALVDAIDFYQEHDFRALTPIRIRRVNSDTPYAKTIFTIGDLHLGPRAEPGNRSAELFRDFLDSLHIEYTEKKVRNIFELGKAGPGSTAVFEVRDDNSVPGRWHEICQIDPKEAVKKLLTMLTEMR